MKTEIKRAVKVALTSGLLVLMWSVVKDVRAQGVPTDTMNMTVSINAGSVVYAVTISSPEVLGYDFGQVNINATTISTKAIPVQNSGNISEFFSLGVVDVTGSNPWVNGVVPATSTYLMQGQFVATGAAQPANASFTSGTNNFVPSAPPATASGRYNEGAVKTTAASSKDLWLQLQTPTGVVDTSVHTLVLSITGQTS